MKLFSRLSLMLLAVIVMVGGLHKTCASAEIKKAKGGYTVEELYAKKGELSGKKVSLRGKAVKFNAGIMGKNWLHLQDGSGKPGTNDITVTTNQSAKVGDTVTATGVMATDRDFGGGYHYEVIIEEATLKAE